MANIISLFSGCGGLDLGFEQVGDYTTVWANDFKHEACVTFRNHFGDIIVEGDIEQIDPYNNPTIPDCDLILGGFPCQDFSIIWKQPGLNGERVIYTRVFCVLWMQRNQRLLLPKMSRAF